MVVSRGSWPYSKSLDSIMKARKTMKNQALIQEVITQLSPKFAPKIPDIKKVCRNTGLSSRFSPLSSTGYRYIDGERVHRARAKYSRYVRLCGLNLVIFYLFTVHQPFTVLFVNSVRDWTFVDPGESHQYSIRRN